MHIFFDSRNKKSISLGFLETGPKDSHSDQAGKSTLAFRWDAEACEGGGEL